MGGKQIILGIPWLRQWNPQIDWTAGRVQWSTSAPEERPTSGLSSDLQLALTNRDNSEETTPEELTTEQQERLQNVPKEYWKYEKIFREEVDTVLPKHTHYDHEIPIKEGESPRFNKIYGLNPRQMDTLDEYLKENLRKGYIRPSTSPAGYPILFVPKKNGKERLCVDYRQLNDITIKNCYPLPLISELRDALAGANWFTALDLKGAYNLIRIKDGEEWKTAFRTRRGHYEYLVMPFGLTNAPATFQNMINDVLREFLDVFVVVYLDDILIFSKTMEEHKGHVHQVLTRLHQHELLVEPEKAKFHTQEVDFLGYTITPGEIRMEKSKVAAIREWPTPKNVKDVRAFLGFVNFYRRFLKGYSKTANPLTSLTVKEIEFAWNEPQEKAFRQIIDAVLSKPVLRMIDPEKPIEVETDASDFAIGGQLGQRDDQGRLHPVAFFSKKLHGPELNYQIHDKELMAIIEAFKEWRTYLSGARHEVKVYTDHKNLAHFTTNKDLNKRQIRWAEFLSEFNFTIIYRKGSENGRADILSRRSDHEQNTPPNINAILAKDKEGNLIPYHRTLAVTTRVTPARPPTEALELIRQVHEAKAHGHQGVAKTFARLKKHHNFKGTRQDVTTVIRNCDLCKKSKAERHRPYGELKALPVPAAAWESVSLDFITSLPPSKEPLTGTSYDNILVVVDRLTTYAERREAPDTPKATNIAASIRKIQDQIKLDLELVRTRMTTYANKTRMKGPSLQEGDSVYLIRRNIKTKRPNDKLDFKKLGPFKILKKLSDTNYHLSLPKNMKIHPIFHIALLEPAPPDAPLETNIEVEGTNEYEVERIIDHRTKNNQDEYLIKWKNYGHEENTWEPIKNLNCPQLLRQFHQHQTPPATPPNPKRASPRRKSPP
ncbi:hypothetical protein BJF96_g10464 [Verticillium dahliae]|uniref:Reverse transcriptase n=1 Tax=Verticillium dahliae TaxID=27337 RepID=A0AA44W8E8_VERDA|nr:hypothetical protein BJF96_g10464 [Verticillium dahliae]